MQLQRVNIQLLREKVNGVQGEVPLPALDAGQVSRTHLQALSEALLRQPSSMPDVAYPRTHDCFERN